LKDTCSGDRTFTEPLEIEVVIAPEQVQATFLEQMLEDTVASYAQHNLV